MTKSNPKNSKKVFDVAKPGQTPADATSRPIIVGHKKTIQEDPMMVKSKEEQAATTMVAPSGNKTNRIDRVVESRTAKDESSEEVAPEEPQKETTDEAPDSDNKDAAPKEDVGVNPALVDNIIQNVSSKKEQSIADEQREKRAKQVQELVASKKYFVKTKLPKGKRHLRYLLLLLLVAVLAAAWYMLVGPGKDMIVSNTSDSDQASSAPAPQETKPQTQAAVDPKAPKTFNDPKYGISFQYPGDWELTVAPDPDKEGIEVITLESTPLTIKTAFTGVDPVDAEVQLRVRIAVQPERFPGSEMLTVCTGESIVVDGKNLNLLFANNGMDRDGIGFIGLMEGNCVRNQDMFTVKDDLKLSNLPATEYVLRASFIYTEAALRKLGATSPEQIAAGQLTGVIVKKEDAKKTTQFTQLSDILKSLKSL